MNKNSNLIRGKITPYKQPVDLSDIKPLTKEGEDFIKFGEANEADFTLFFVMFNMWMQLPAAQKESVIIDLVRTGKVEMSSDVGKDSQDQ